MRKHANQVRKHVAPPELSGLAETRIKTLDSLSLELLNEIPGQSVAANSLIKDPATIKHLITRSGNILFHPYSREYEEEEVILFRLFQRFGRKPHWHKYLGFHFIDEDKTALRLLLSFAEYNVRCEPLLGSDDDVTSLLGHARSQYESRTMRPNKMGYADLLQKLSKALDTEEGKQFVGEGFTVIVDEYQDTNPVQEDIYFKLAGRKGDISVVGDDDQAIYRWRAASVEHFIHFGRQVNNHHGFSIEHQPLTTNYRSHPKIVEFLNFFLPNSAALGSVDDINTERIAGKGLLKAWRDDSDVDPHLFIFAQSDWASKTVRLIKKWLESETASARNQIAVISPSTKTPS